MAYFAKKRLSDNKYVERALSKSKPKDEEGFKWEKISKPQDVEVIRASRKLYNDKRFKTSLLLDEKLSHFGFTVYYAAISDSLFHQNWPALKVIFNKMIGNNDATENDLNYFKSKLLQEEGVDLDEFQ